MTGDEIQSALDLYADAKSRHDVPAILELCHEDCYYESVPMGGHIRGKAALAAFYTELFAGLPDYFGEFDGTAIGDDTAVAWGHWGGTLGDEFMGVEVESGRTLDIPVVFVCTFRDGLLIGDSGYFDAATLCEQAGRALEALRPPSDDDVVERLKRFWADPTRDRVSGPTPTPRTGGTRRARRGPR